MVGLSTQYSLSLSLFLSLSIYIVLERQNRAYFFMNEWKDVLKLWKYVYT